MRQLRILSIADVPEDPNAGAAGAEYQTIQALRQLGHTVDALWSPDIGRRIGHGNLHYLFELPRRYETLVVDHLTRERYDVVHVSQPHGFRAARTLQRRWPLVPFIHRSHGFEPRVEEIVARWKATLGADQRPAWRRSATALMAAGLRRHNREICRWADGHLMCSTQDAAFMIERFHVPPRRVAVVTHAAPDEYVQTPALPLDSHRLEHVLYVGQFAFVKAPMVVADAMNRIAAARPSARFTWIASKIHHDEIRQLLSPDVQSRMSLLDWMHQRELRSVYDGAGVFLFPSFFEGTGKASIEALSRGLCVVATDVGGMHDMIEHDVSGVLLPPGDSKAVSDAAIAIMDNLARATDLAKSGARRARQYSWQLTAKKTAQFYESRIAEKRSEQLHRRA